MRMKSLSGLFLLMLMISGMAYARGPLCSQEHSPLLGHDVNFCIDRSTPDQAALPGEAVVYFMHGTNGGAQTWTRNNYEHSLAELRKSRKMVPTTYVSFDTSAYSFFTDHPSGDKSRAYETWLVREFIPFIEKTYGVCAQRECRALLGESMGGFGALKTALRHPELFSSVAVNSPAFAPFDELGTKSQWIKYYSTKPVGPIKGALLTQKVFDIFPNEAAFEANDPVNLVSRRPFSDPMFSLYLDMGGRDSYGFYDGYALFTAAMDRRGYPFETLFEKDAGHDMWKRHAKDALAFIDDHWAASARN